MLFTFICSVVKNEVKDSLVLLRFDSYESISVQPFLRRRLVNESCQIACERAVDD